MNRRVFVTSYVIYRKRSKETDRPTVTELKNVSTGKQPKIKWSDKYSKDKVTESEGGKLGT